MQLKQKQKYVDVYNDVIRKHHSDLFFPNMRGGLNISNLYRLLFGYDSQYEFRLILDKKQRKYKLFIKLGVHETCMITVPKSELTAFPARI